MTPKALLIHADGTVEELSPNDAVGSHIIRPPVPCKECGCKREGVSRVFRGHFASNHQTVNAEHFATGPGPTNVGTIVFIEEPS
jgi:hypothetical protein